MRVVTFLVVACSISFATLIPSVSFEDLIASSDQIVTGTVLGSTASWDASHRLIWTRYQISVEAILKGEQAKTVTVSEPGGELNGESVSVDGVVSYQTGEHVALFLQRYPTGEKRTVGWAQGKFAIDPSGRIHPAGSGSAEPARRAHPGTPIGSLDGLSLNVFRQKVTAVLRGGSSE